MQTRVIRAKDYLERAIDIDERIKNKLLEKEQWRAIAECTTAHSEGERVQSSGSLHKMEDAVIKINEIEADIDAMTKVLIDMKLEIIKTIDEIEDTTSYSLLHKRYVQLKSMEEIQDEKQISQSTRERKFADAYNLVQNILDERFKNGE